MPSDLVEGEVVILLVPRGLCSSNYVAGGLPEGDIEIRYDAFTEQGWIRVGERELRVRKHGMASGTWSLEYDGIELMVGQKASAFSRRMEIQALHGAEPEGTLYVDPMGVIRSGYTLEMEGRVLGRIEPVHAFTRRTVLTCDPSVGLLPRLFAFWMVGLMRKRAAAAAAS